MQFVVQRIIFSLFTVVFCTACLDYSAPEYGILLKNDIQDTTYNVIVVDNIKSSAGSYGQRIELSPGESSHVKMKGISALRFSRRYANYTQIYDVECDGGLQKGVTMKLIDVHLDRIAGGCRLDRSYRQ